MLDFKTMKTEELEKRFEQNKKKMLNMTMIQDIKEIIYENTLIQSELKKRTKDGKIN